jgi:hypothetical protein
MTQAEIDAKRAQRVLRQAAAKTWMDMAGADHRGVDAIVYPGLLSDISFNDGGGGRASFGRRDTPGAANGIPTVVFPAGSNDHGQPIDIQLLGRAWDDDKLVGMAYAFEHYAEAAGKGHVAPSTAPALVYGQAAMARTGLVRDRRTNTYAQQLTVQNTSSEPIAGPVSLLLDNLSANATLANQTGVAANYPPLGVPYVTVPGTAGGLAPGASANVVLQFSNPTNAAINYTTRVLPGTVVP